MKRAILGAMVIAGIITTIYTVIYVVGWLTEAVFTVAGHPFRSDPVGTGMMMGLLAFTASLVLVLCYLIGSVLDNK